MKRSDSNNMFDLMKLLLSLYSGPIFMTAKKKCFLGKALDQAYAEGYKDCLRKQRGEEGLVPLDEDKVSEKINNFWKDHHHQISDKYKDIPTGTYNN